jgi:hypothetical protein
MSKSFPPVFSSLREWPKAAPSRPDLRESLALLGVKNGRIETLPFAVGDTTAGSECELQVAVHGTKEDVDLPRTILASNYFANALRRTMSGDNSRKVVSDLERYLDDNPDQVWENSWVRFPTALLGSYALTVLDHDLLADKAKPEAGARSDRERYFTHQAGADYLRIPISYLIKLSLADAIGQADQLSPIILRTGQRLMAHFLNDNTSPETYSFHVSSLHPSTGNGRLLAAETAKRHLLTQLLVMHANQRYRLKENGQEAMIFFSPHPPIRQKRLNEAISDSYYRKLFMSPCLSGWNHGESKHQYMKLCHEVLSRSHLNAVAKMREAGIITSNLMVLPTTSNISLANNGVHISLGSRRLTAHLADSGSGFGRPQEKYLADLAVKIMEHFLPLFVGTYSAAPYRLDFADFHPERVLGFLPHQLDYTHLRMLWRRWQKKADNSIFGRPQTPFGPPLLDGAIRRIFLLRGDYVPDFRLIDYLVALMSTERSPALNGEIGSYQKLQADLEHLGVFDSRMSLYLPIKPREYQTMGFSGFEGRFYSLFADLTGDLGGATNLQMLLQALAYKYMADGICSHDDIPDQPVVESERRQFFFGTAIGIPTFYVRQDTANRFMRRILSHVKSSRASHRYPGYLRVKSTAFQLGLLAMLRQDGADLVEMLDLGETLSDLEARIRNPRLQVSGRLTEEILNSLPGRLSSPLKARGHDFNRAAEKYYREDLSRKHFCEAIDILGVDLDELSKSGDADTRQALGEILRGREVGAFLAECRSQQVGDNPSPTITLDLIHLLLLAEHFAAGVAVLDVAAAA